jgi:hypothetical protein
MIDSRDEGDVELVFASGAVLRSRSVNGGEMLIWTTKPWLGPIHRSESELAPYDSEYGDFVKYDVSKEPGYADLIGQRLDGFHWYRNQFGICAGTILEFDGGGNALTIYAAADETWVFPGVRKDRFEEMDYTAESGSGS